MASPVDNLEITQPLHLKNGPVDLRPLGPERLRLGAPVGAGTGADGEAVQDLIPDAQHLNVMPHIVKKRQYRNRS